jgi:hypothetical protein
MSPRPSCSDGSSSKLVKPFSPALRLRPLSSRWSKWADRPVPAFAWANGAPCCCCGCCVEVVPKREAAPSPPVCVGFGVWFAVVDCCVAPPMPPKRLFVCVAGCAVVAPPKRPPVGAADVGAGEAAGLAPNAPPNRLPPNPPLLVGCVVPAAAPEAAPPKPPNKPPVGAADVVAGLLPNRENDGVGAPLEAGGLPPMLPKRDMLTVLLRGVVKSSAIALFCREQELQWRLASFDLSLPAVATW